MSIRGIFLFGPIIILMFGCATMGSEYNRVIESNSIDQYEDFLTKYPKDHPMSVLIKSKMEDIKKKKLYKEAEKENSFSSYKYFIETYPTGILSDIARSRLKESAMEGFIRACRIGTSEAFRGFLQSYPEYENKSLVEARIHFLLGIEKGTRDALQKYILEFPNNPFVIEAIAAYPSIWFTEAKKRLLIDVVGIEEDKTVPLAVGINDYIPTSPLDDIERVLGKAGIFLIKKSKGNKAYDNGANLSISIVLKNKNEYIVGKSRFVNPPPFSIYPSPLGVIIGIALLEEREYSYIDNINYYSITVHDKQTGYIYYSDLTDLDSKINKESMISALGMFGSTALPPLMFAIYDENRSVKIAATNLLGNIEHPDANKLLLKILDEGESELQIIAVRKLSEKKKQGAIKPLLSRLKSEDYFVRNAVAKTLGNICNRSAPKELILALQDNDPNLRWGAAEALGEIGDKQTVESLKRSLTDQDWRVRKASVIALVQIGDQSVIETLLSMATMDPNSEVQQAANEAIKNIRRP